MLQCLRVAHTKLSANEHKGWDTLKQTLNDLWEYGGFIIKLWVADYDISFVNANKMFWGFFPGEWGFHCLSLKCFPESVSPSE